MAVLGTSVSDPLFYQHRMVAAGQALGAFVSGYQQNKAKQEAADQADIQQTLKLLSAYPELASGGLGEQLKTKYGATHPEIAGIVDVVKNRQSLADEIPKSGKLWEDNVGKLQSAYQTDQQRLAAMPDTTSMNVPLDSATSSIFSGSGATAPPMPPMRSAVGPDYSLSPYMTTGAPQPPLRAAQNVTMEVPNRDKQTLAAQLAQQDPNSFPQKALSAMSPIERMRAKVYAKSTYGYTPDPETDSWEELKALPEHVRAQRMVELGMIPPGSTTADVIAYENKLKVAPATQATMDHQDKQQEQSLSNRQAQMEESDSLQRDRMAYADQLRAAAQGRSVQDQKDIIDYRESKKPDKSSGSAGVGWKSIVNDSRTSVTDYDARMREALTGLSGKQRAAAAEKFRADNGERPVPVPETVARSIDQEIQDQGLQDDDATEAAIAASSQYMAKKRAGTPANQAAKEAVSYVSPTNRIKIDFSGIADVQARAAAVTNYASRLQAGAPQADAYRAAMAEAEAAGTSVGPPMPGNKAPTAHAGAAPAAQAAPATAGPAKAAAGPSEADVRSRVKASYPKATPAQQDAIVAETLRRLQGGGGG